MASKIIKKCILMTIKDIFLNKMCLFNLDGLSVNTITWPTTDHKNDIIH